MRENGNYVSSINFGKMDYIRPTELDSAIFLLLK